MPFNLALSYFFTLSCKLVLSPQRKYKDRDSTFNSALYLFNQRIGHILTNPMTTAKAIIAFF